MACHGAWASWGQWSFPRGHAPFNWMKAGCYLKGWLGDVTEKGFMSLAQLNPETQNAQAPGSRMRERKKAKEGSEEEARKKRGTGKEPAINNHLCCTHASTVNPQDKTTLPISAQGGHHFQEAKLGPRSRLAGFEVHMWMYISNSHSTTLIKFPSCTVSCDLMLRYSLAFYYFILFYLVFILVSGCSLNTIKNP